MSGPQIVLITGANQGIGYAMSKILATSSSTIHVIIGSRSAENGAKAVQKLHAEPGLKALVSTIQLDVLSQDSVAAAYQEIETKYGRLDALVNNAGVASADANFVAQLQVDLEVNVVGAARVSETFKPLLAKSSNPYLIHVASIMGLAMHIVDAEGPADWKSYRISKAAMIMLALGDVKDAKYQRGNRLKVYAVCPGFVVSNLRGTSEEARGGWGHAGDPEDAGRMILSVLTGQRDRDAGKFIHKDGVYAW